MGMAEAMNRRWAEASQEFLASQRRVSELVEDRELSERVVAKITRAYLEEILKREENKRRDRLEKLKDIKWRYVEGPSKRGRADMGMINSTGCTSVWGSTYPYHPYPFPWTSHLFQDSPSVAMGIFEGHMAKMADGFKAVRLGRNAVAHAVGQRRFARRELRLPGEVHALPLVPARRPRRLGPKRGAAQQQCQGRQEERAVAGHGVAPESDQQSDVLAELSHGRRGFARVP